MPLISVIVPIHNAGDRLYECLDTLINQTLQDIEIICILDAPTDGSIGIVKEYALKDDRIKYIINETNLHIAESRNKGISLATGEYIGFSDHDDTRALNMYELLYKKARECDADIVFSNSIIKHSDRTEIIKYNNPGKDDVIRSIILPMDPAVNQNILSKSVWDSIFKKEFIDTHFLSFKSRLIFYEEDTLFNLQAFLSTDKIHYINQEFYIWNKQIEGESSKPDSNVPTKQIQFLKEIKEYLIQANQLEHYKDELATLISDFIWDKQNYKLYTRLPKDPKQQLSKLLWSIRFPLFGRSKTLKLFSKKRLRLFKFVLSLYIIDYPYKQYYSLLNSKLLT